MNSPMILKWQPRVLRRLGERNIGALSCTNAGEASPERNNNKGNGSCWV